MVCLLLEQVDFIHINCFAKMVSFLEFDTSDELFLSAKQVNEFVKNDVEVFMILNSLKANTKAVLDELFVVSDFL